MIKRRLKPNSKETSGGGNLQAVMTKLDFSGDVQSVLIMTILDNR